VGGRCSIVIDRVLFSSCCRSRRPKADPPSKSTGAYCDMRHEEVEFHAVIFVSFENEAIRALMPAVMAAKTVPQSAYASTVKIQFGQARMAFDELDQPWFCSLRVAQGVDL